MKKTTLLLMLLASSFMLTQASEHTAKRGKPDAQEELEKAAQPQDAQQDTQEELNKADKAQVATNSSSSESDDSDDDFDNFSSPSGSPVPMSYVIGWTEEEIAELNNPENRIYVTQEQIKNCGYQQADVRSFETDQKGPRYESL